MADQSLANFYKSLRERNASRSYYAPVAASVLQADVTDPYGSATSNFGANLVKGLLGGVAANMFRKEQADYETDLTNQLRATLGGASAFKSVLPEDDLAAISAFKLARDIDRQEKIQALNDELNFAGLKKETEVGAEQRALMKAAGVIGSEEKAPSGSIGDLSLEPLGVASSVDGGVVMQDGSVEKPKQSKPIKLDKKILAGVNPIIKEQVRQEEDTLKRNTAEEDNARMELLTKTPSVAQFAAMQKAIPLVEGFKDQNTKSSDVGFVYNYIKALDDGAVRGEEIDMASSSNPVIKKFQTQLEGALKGTSELTPQLKNIMFQELKLAQKNVYEQALADSQRRLDIVKQRGGNPNFASPIPLDLKFEIPTSAAPIPSSVNLQSEYNKLRSSGMSEAEAKAALRGGLSTSGRSAPRG